MIASAERFPRSRKPGRAFLKSAQCRFESDWGHPEICWWASFSAYRLQGVGHARKSYVHVASTFGEGSAARVKPLLAQEKKRTARLVGDVPIYDVIVGNGEGQVPLSKLERHLTKLPSNITVKQLDALESRLAALGSKVGPAAMPKGPLPTAAKMKGVQRTVRRR